MERLAHGVRVLFAPERALNVLRAGNAIRIPCNALLRWERVLNASLRQNNKDNPSTKEGNAIATIEPTITSTITPQSAAGFMPLS
jgi:hypothetical protein